MVTRHSAPFLRQRGQALIFAALTLPLTAAAIGLVVDVGWAHFRKQACQSAAVSAAMAGAVAAQNASTQSCGSGWTCQSDTSCPASLTTPTDPVQAACLYAQQNGFTNGSTSPSRTVTVAANTSGSGVSGMSPSYYISVTVSERLPLTFLAVLNQQYAWVRSKSTAGVWLPSAGGCIYTLNTSATDISMNGVTAITTGCGIYDNSNNGSAISIVGNNGQITATGGASVNVVGNVSTHSPSQISPSPNLGVNAASDPFSNMGVPSSSTCINYTGQSTLSAGTYCNQISLNNGTLTLNPGVYILQGGIDIGGNATLNNNTTGGDGSGGVMLYVTGGDINFHGSDSATLNAPTTGTYRGILMWQDKSDTNSVTLKGGSSLLLNGTLYFPKAALSYNGGTNTTNTNTTIVCDTLTLVGNSYINAAASTPYTGTSSGGAYLIQ